MTKLMTVLAAFVCISPLRAVELPKPIFYLPLDGSTRAAIAGGASRPQMAEQADMLLAVLAANQPRFKPGKVGQGCEVENAPLVFRSKGNFRPDEGTCSLWLSPNFRGDDKNIYCTFFGAEKWGMLYKYQLHTSLTFGTAKPDRDLYYDCNVRSIASWRPGQWHHVVATWSRAHNARRIYVDGKLEASVPFPYHRAFDDGPLFIGAGCLLYPNHVAHAVLDEVAIWDRPLDQAAVARLYALGRRGQPIRPSSRPADTVGTGAEHVNVVQPQAPAPPVAQTPKTKRSRTRSEMSLDGWWQFLAAPYALDALPAAGWGLAKVPGHYTTRGEAIKPNGKPARGRWRGKPWSEFGMVYYQRSFAAPARWQGSQLLLHLDGVDGLAEVYVNGQRVGTLLCWEDEDYIVTDLVRVGRPNTVTLALWPFGVGKASGVYGSVSVRAVANAFVRDIVVRPRVVEGKLDLSCDVWRALGAGEAELAFEVCPAAEPAKAVKHFRYTFHLASAKRAGRALWGQAQRVECTFAWPDARRWTYDDPYQYVARVQLRRDGELIDETPAYRFGFREFSVRGSEFFLNGVPTHLRGHQLNMAWRDQMAWLKDFAVVGMNCVELAGPISSRWLPGRPYREKLFAQILDFADEHGIIAIPCLPGARMLQDKIFDVRVAAYYRRRVDKFIRRCGNHASAGMWFMDFNLAGYRWNHPPTKIDGCYKPTNDAFKKKERYSLEAQRIAQSIDPRPIYHHACGNFGDIYTLNCYIGPSCPLQEREEWPRRWAERRPFPLVACEHGMMLVPYWYRPRRFPLSYVYAGEPIFDEISAMYLGPQAYRMVTPDLFDIYRSKPYGNRLKRLVALHPGYHEVKALVARHSLRAWRTWGVSGIIYNAIQWDFHYPDGKPTPVMRSQQRYFGPTDFYVAGASGDWPSKDHSFFAGERVEKQVVLLNDLTRNVTEMLHWSLANAAGKVQAQGEMRATFKAGVPTFMPVAVTAPAVARRTEFTLAVRSGKREDAIGIQIFPAARKPSPHGAILVYDPCGETTRMLDRAKVKWAPLVAGSALRAARLVVVGKRCWGERFVTLAKRVRLEDAVAAGLNLLVLEQTARQVMGLELRERSTRKVFVSWPGHPALDGLGESDFVNLRGQSDLVEPYPEAPPETKKQWPERYFKWGNRGVVATFVYAKPHYGPFVPVLECGFDLAESPLMQAHIGKGMVVLCQVGATSRYGTDPVSTRLLNNLLEYATVQAKRPSGFKLVSVSEAVRDEGLKLDTKRFFRGDVTRHPLLAGLSPADLYLKQWREQPVVCEANGWRVIAKPGIVAVKEEHGERLVVCMLDPGALGRTRARIKALRFRSILDANLGRPCPVWRRFITAPPAAYEPNKWERMPRFMNW